MFLDIAHYMIIISYVMICAVVDISYDTNEGELNSMEA